MRLLIVQYGGDLREAQRRLARGNGATYYAQQYTIDAMADLAKRIDDVAVLCCMTQCRYEERLDNGVRAIGGGFRQRIALLKLIGLIHAHRPTHLSIRSPITGLFAWAIAINLQTIAVLADSFNGVGWRKNTRYRVLARLLNHRRISWVANHNVPACRSLARIGVNPDKIIPWDYEPPLTPEPYSPKSRRIASGTPHLVYVGAVAESKGVSDLLSAVAELARRNLAVRLDVIGLGDLDGFRQHAERLGIQDRVVFEGLLANREIVPRMRQADLVVVPSRHEYPEAFPCTIYEALCARTPIVVSDHPMFTEKLQHRISAVIFPAGNALALASSIEDVLSDSALWQALSTASYQTWQSLQVPVKWAELFRHWLSTGADSHQWLYAHRLASGYYDTPRA